MRLHNFSTRLKRCVSYSSILCYIEETTVAAIPVVNARYGTITGVIPLDSVKTVTFLTPLPTANYGISITPVCNSSIAAQPTPLFSLNVGSKLTTGFSIRIENNIAEITSVDWMAVHTS